MKKLRIAQVTNLQESVPPLNKNGLEQVVSYLTEELVAMGHDVTLFATADSKTSAKLIPIWPQAVSRDKYGSLLSPEMFNIWSVAEAFIRHKEFDIIHCHSGYISQHFAGAIPTPVVHTIHNPISYDFFQKFSVNHQPYFQNIEQKHFSYSNTVVVSKFQAKKYIGRSDLIYNGIPLDDWNMSSGGNYLAFLGYISSDKGAAEAIQSVLSTGERLKIAGPIRDDDPLAKKYFEERVKPYLNDKIEYIGPLNYEEKVRFLSGAKATLMPIQWDEPFGMVAIESMASGTPVIAWNRAAMPEIIEDGISGYLVNSIEEMTEKIKSIDKLKRSDARKRVEENFTIEQMAKKYVALYEGLVNSRSNASS